MSPFPLLDKEKKGKREKEKRGHLNIESYLVACPSRYI